MDIHQSKTQPWDSVFKRSLRVLRQRDLKFGEAERELEASLDNAAKGVMRREPNRLKAWAIIDLAVFPDLLARTSRIAIVLRNSKVLRRSYFRYRLSRAFLSKNVAVDRLYTDRKYRRVSLLTSAWRGRMGSLARAYYRELQALENPENLQSTQTKTPQLRWKSTDLSGLPQTFKEIKVLSRSMGLEDQKFWPPREGPSWNPLSQCMPALGGAPLDWYGIMGPLAQTASRTMALPEIAHEMMHLVLWEPFFSGNLDRLTQKKFVRLSLLFEAGCFWYADWLVTPRLRKLTSDGDRLFNNYCISTPAFCPRDTLAEVGVSDPSGAINFYLDKFSGENCRRYRITDQSPLLSALGSRFRRVREVQVENTGEFYGLLKKRGVFDEYYERFCSKSGVPALFSDDVLALARSDDTDREYIHRVLMGGREALRSLERRKLVAIQARRDVQKRAYLALSLRHTLVSRECYAIDDQFESVSNRCIQELEHYCFSLERGLVRLCRDEALCPQWMDRIDRRLETNCCSLIEKMRVYSSRRHIVGSTDRTLSLEKNTLQACALFVQTLKQRRDVFSSMSQESRNATGEFWLALQEYISARSRRSLSEELQISFVALLKRPDVLKFWGFPLWRLNPRKGCFGDPGFSYS